MSPEPSARLAGRRAHPCQPVCRKPLSPQPHGLPTGPDDDCNGAVLVAVHGQQDDLRAERQTDRGASAPGPVL